MASDEGIQAIQRTYYDTAKEQQTLQAESSMNRTKPALSEGEKTTIGELCVKAGVLTESQLEYAVRVHSKFTTSRTLTQVLRDLNYVTPQQLKNVVKDNCFSIRLGELLVELGVISGEQLETALSVQRGTGKGKKLGEVLVESRIVGERELMDVLSLQLGFPYVEPQSMQIGTDLLQRASLNWYLTHGFIPVGRTGEKVLVALTDPLDHKSLDAARMIFREGVVPAICTKNGLAEAVERFETHGIEARPKVIDESKVINAVDAIFRDAIRMQASDVHVEPQKNRLRVRFRVDGVLVLYKEYDLQIAPALMNRIKILAEADIAEKRRHQDGRFLFQDSESKATVDMRASFYVTVWGEKAVLRLLSNKGLLLRLEDIDIFPKSLERFCFDALDVPSGVILITGPTGSGKTTTLYCCVSYLDKPDISIVTAEDPVEYVIDGIAQCSINPKINLTFEETLRHIVRQDPDIIVVGEIRDQFSAETCIQASLVGHKVLATFHTEDSVGALVRLLNMNIEPFLIASTLVSVVAQRLLRRLCPDCQETYIPTPTDLQRLGYNTSDLKELSCRIGRGCAACHYSGYKGRMGVHEILILNEMARNAILEKKSSHEIRKICMETTGLVTLLEDGLVKAVKGETSLQEVLRQLPRVSKPRPINQLKRLLGE